MRILVSTLLAFAALNAFADFKPVAPGSSASEVADQASDIFEVTNLTIGNYAYKIVSMDSKLNGDLNATTMVLVGEGGVGGLAGYEQAFQLTPVPGRSSLISAELVKDRIKLTFYNNDSGTENSILVIYDPATKTLTEK